MSGREVMIMVAPNGARRHKQDHPGLPLTPDELAREAVACAKAGAAAMHLHVRDDSGEHSLDAARYRTALRSIAETLAAENADLVLQITTESVGRYDTQAQIGCVRAVLPEAVSLALRELVPDDAEETLERARGFFRWLKVMSIVPQFILYDPADVTRFLRLWRGNESAGGGVIPQRRPFLLFVLGRYGGEPAEPEMLRTYLDALGEEAAEGVEWMACAFGPHEAEVLLTAAERGGHVRLGFENNLHLPDGGLAPSNAALVERFRERLSAAGMKPMSAADARRLMRACGR